MVSEGILYIEIGKRGRATSIVYCKYVGATKLDQ